MLLTGQTTIFRSRCRAFSSFESQRPCTLSFGFSLGKRKNKTAFFAINDHAPLKGRNRNKDKEGKKKIPTVRASPQQQEQAPAKLLLYIPTFPGSEDPLFGDLHPTTCRGLFSRIFWVTVPMIREMGQTTSCQSSFYPRTRSEF